MTQTCRGLHDVFRTVNFQYENLELSSYRAPAKFNYRVGIVKPSSAVFK